MNIWSLMSGPGKVKMTMSTSLLGGRVTLFHFNLISSFQTFFHIIIEMESKQTQTHNSSSSQCVWESEGVEENGLIKILINCNLLEN